MTTLNDSGRSQVVSALRRELFGPSALVETDLHAVVSGNADESRPIKLDPPPRFDDARDSYGPFHDDDTGEEILLRDRPTKRYGIGVLYPAQQPLEDVNEGDADESADEVGTNTDDRDRAATNADESISTSTLRQGADDGDDFDLTATSQYRPSAMAVSFLAQIAPGDQVAVAVTGARYEEVRVTVEGRERSWYVRRPLAFEVNFAAPTESGKQKQLSKPPDVDPLRLRVDLLARSRGESEWLVTIALVNEAENARSADLYSLFQSAFSVSISNDQGPTRSIIPYPDPRSERLLDRDAEARSLDLMYRNAPTFGIGHGCAATWDEPWGQLKASAVRADALPTFETPSVTPDVTLPDKSRLEVPMGPLAGLDPADDGFESVRFVADAYREWILSLEDEASLLDGHRRIAADDHIAKCRRAEQRIRDGIDWLASDPIARRAFVLANRAVLEQQLNFRSETRATRLSKLGEPVVDRGTPTESWRDANRRWRAFQIGFLVASARSAVDGSHADRETVELIFFPTGGGKTEAYLGLAAFCLFYQRLTGRKTGVSVLMRYTLRLLTSQQFLRASALICAMELIRLQEGLGDEKFTIGIWVGRSTTPNTRKQASSEFGALAKGYGSNPFLVLRCPWCAAQMGEVEAEKGLPKSFPKIAGYRQTQGSVEFLCPDRRCPFTRGLPVFVVDEDVYDNRPSIVIGTVDKFAMLAFNPLARALFGLDDAGERECDPPNLIIQDELHLIAGPLGSMVGLYEPIIEHLCTRIDAQGSVKPKIVGSTATIRNYPEQIRGLYGRTDAALFPPHGLDASDSFFAQHAKDAKSGELVQGRLYIGVHAPGLGSIQTAQVRTGAALLQSAVDLPEAERDPWWTSMMFFNSLRELGTSVSLLQSDIPDYLFAKKLRDGHLNQRFVNNLMELTSRLRQDEIPEAISRLERTATSGRAVDACLASNIIEVGVDIPRLSLLTVLGQPKSTSQYIQITGRVGRNWQERPGLVVTIYSAARPRDRSHFERFQSYHQRLYAEVEPVSVTPFSTPVLRRAAHAAAIVYTRQTGPSTLEPSPSAEIFELFDEAERLLVERAETADPESAIDVKRWMAQRRTEWKAWEPVIWEAKTANDDGPLLRRAGEWIDDDLVNLTWPTPMSMRDVDAECRCAITSRYALARGEQTDEEGTS